MEVAPTTVVWQPPQCSLHAVEVLQSRAGLLNGRLSSRGVNNIVRSGRSGQRLFVLFPGNPGIVQFYKKFAALLATAGVDVLVMGYAGHSAVGLNDGRVFGLQDQLDTAEMLMSEILTDKVVEQYRARVSIGGHSIGVFVALHMAARFSCLKRCIFLCGVVSRIMESPNGQKMFFVGGSEIVYQLVTFCIVYLVHLMPSCVLLYLLRWQVPIAPHSLVQLFVKHRNNNVLYNCFNMARHEFQRLRNPDKSLLKSVGSRIVFYCVPHDGWSPLQHVHEAREACVCEADIVVESDESVPHAWCLEHSEVVVRKGVLPFI
ncbi:putative Lipid droplet associated hydrolase [Trypanosoma vivax]|nr:putative Lipid droplet associated hydrolase [Trypanosoma vivax]